MTIQMRNNTPLQKGSAKVEFLIGKPNSEFKNILKFSQQPDKFVNLGTGIKAVKADPEPFSTGFNRR